MSRRLALLVAELLSEQRQSSLEFQVDHFLGREALHQLGQPPLLPFDSRQFVPAGLDSVCIALHRHASNQLQVRAVKIFFGVFEEFWLRWAEAGAIEK